MTHINHTHNNSYTKGAQEASPKPFYNKSKLSRYLDQQSEMFQSLLLMSRSATI